LLAGLETLGIMRKGGKIGDVGLLLLIFALLVTHGSSSSSSWRTLENRIGGWIVKMLGLLLCYVANRSTQSEVLSQPWLRWCGLISYEWYLLHQPAIIWPGISLDHRGSMEKYLAIVEVWANRFSSLSTSLQILLFANPPARPSETRSSEGNPMSGFK